jgi:hypothetical protein
MALAKWKCVNCGIEFEAGDWFCKSGEPHTIETKKYYVLDAPSDKRDCKNARLQILNVVPEHRENVPGGDTRVVPGIHVEFVRGLYETDNPQLQMALDKRRNVLSGDEGKREWERVYFSDAEKSEMEQMRLRGEITRLQQENNRVLAEQQKLRMQKSA